MQRLFSISFFDYHLFPTDDRTRIYFWRDKMNAASRDFYTCITSPLSPPTRRGFASIS